MYRRFFGELMTACQDYTVVCTGWSFICCSAGFAFVYEDKVFFCCIHRLNSLPAAKFYAVYQAPPFI
jgi:hypothetical protein